MRAVLYLHFGLGLVAMAAGALGLWAAFETVADGTGPVFLMPEMLACGLAILFGFLACTVAAGAFVIRDAIDRLPRFPPAKPVE